MEKMYNGEITELEGNIFTLKLEKAKDNLHTGDWITARYVIENETIDTVFTQVVKDYFISEMTNYINNNYQSFV